MMNSDVWLAFGILLSTPVSICAYCQRGCTCNGTSWIVVECINANLRNIPIMLNPRTKSLNLRGNRIPKIRDGELSIYADLDNLDLGSNEIDHLDSKAFQRLGNLRFLNLSGNLLSKIDLGSFDGLDKLEGLDLSNNGLNRLSGSIFSQMFSLKSLNLSKNSINAISPAALRGLGNLETLYLQHNDLTSFVAPDTLPTLTELDISYNYIESLSNYSFNLVPRLKVLRLNGNDISMIHATTFGRLHRLQHLNLDDNELQTVPTLSFRSLTELQSLTISRNPLSEIPTSAFEGLSSLRVLVINECPVLKRVALNGLSGLHALETLWLSRNPVLSDIDPFAFELEPTVSQLKHLHLSFNNLSYLNFNLLPWQALETMDLRDNPWTCNCDLSWLSDNNDDDDKLIGRLLSKPGVSEAKCALPVQLRGTSLTKFESDHARCKSSILGPNSNIIYIITASVAAGLLLLVGIIVLLMHHRDKLYCGHTSRSNRTPYYTPGDEKTGQFPSQTDSRRHYSGCSNNCVWSSPERQSFLSSDGSSSTAYYPSSSSAPTAPHNELSRDSSFKILAEYPVPITEL